MLPPRRPKRPHPQQTLTVATLRAAGSAERAGGNIRFAHPAGHGRHCPPPADGPAVVIGASPPSAYRQDRGQGCQCWGFQTRSQGRAREQKHRPRSHPDARRGSWVVPSPTILIDGVNVMRHDCGMAARRWVLGRCWRISKKIGLRRSATKMPEPSATCRRRTHTYNEGAEEDSHRSAAHPWSRPSTTVRVLSAGCRFRG